MKRLAITAAIALAVSAIGIGPAAASSLDVVPELTTQEDAQAAPGETENAADPADPAVPADPDDSDTGDIGVEEGSDKPEADDGQSQDEGQDGTETGDPTAPGDNTADQDGTADGASETPTDDGSEEAEESEPIEADFTLEKTKMTADEIGDPDKGIGYTIDSLKAGDIVTAEPGEDTPTTVGEDGPFTGTIRGNTELKTGDTLEVTVTVEREGQEAQTFSGSIEVVAAEDGDETAPIPELTVTPKTQGLPEFRNEGVSLMLVNCVADSEVKFRVSTKADPDTTIWEDTQKAGEDAAGAATFVPEADEGPGWVGDYLVTATCGDQSTEATFTVTDDESVIDPKLGVEPQKLSGEDFINRDKGVTINVTDCKPGSDVLFEVWGLEPSGKLYEQTTAVNKNGAASVQIYGLENKPEAYAGTYKVFANCLDRELSDEFAVTSSGSDGSGGSSDGSGGSGGSADSGDSGDSGSIPRTGAELTGLGAGAALILAGAMTIIFARRRAQL